MMRDIEEGVNTYMKMSDAQVQVVLVSGLLGGTGAGV